jgi:hypothetical protein
VVEIPLEFRYRFGAVFFSARGDLLCGGMGMDAKAAAPQEWGPAAMRPYLGFFEGRCRAVGGRRVACGVAREGAGCEHGALEGGGIRGGFFAGSGAGWAACEQGFDGGDAASCAERVAGDGFGFPVAGGESRGGAAEVDAEAARGGEGGASRQAGGGSEGTAAQGAEVARDEGENGGGEAASVGDEKAAEPRGDLIGGGIDHRGHRELRGGR